MSDNKLNKPAFFALIIYPVYLIALAVYYFNEFGVGWLELGIFVTGYYISNITVGIGLHRLWSHDSYKTNKFVEWVLMFLSAGTLQGPVLSWASNHFRHHTYTDTDQDPHSPTKYNSKLLGFWWSHMGWMLVGDGSFRSIDRVTMVKLGKKTSLRFQLKYYWQLALLMNSLVPAIFGFILTGDLKGAFAGFLFIGLGRALQQQITFFVNSLCHFVGTQKYTDGTSRDIWWLAILLLGENWHNFHHAFPTDYRNGAKWYQADVHKWIIYLMSKVGLAWDLKRTAKVRVDAKVSKTMQDFITARKADLAHIQERLNEMVLSMQDWASDLEDSSNEMRDNLKAKYNETLEHLQTLSTQTVGFDNPSDKIVKNLREKLALIERKFQKLCSEIEQIKYEAVR